MGLARPRRDHKTPLLNLEGLRLEERHLLASHGVSAPLPTFPAIRKLQPSEFLGCGNPFACLLVNPTGSYSDKSLLVCHVASEFSALRRKAPGYWSSSEPPRGHQTVSKLHSERRLGREAPFLRARSEPGCPFHTANSEHDQIKLIIMPYVCSNHVPLQSLPCSLFRS